MTEIFPVALGFNDCYLIRDKEAIMIDGGTPNRIGTFKRAIQSVSVEPADIKLVIVTHGHIDHIGSLSDIKKLTGASVLAHRLDKDCLEKGEWTETQRPKGIGGWRWRWVWDHVGLPLVTSFYSKAPPTSVDNSAKSVLTCSTKPVFMTDYWLDLFTPETWEEARLNNFKVTGFRLSRWKSVSKIKPGDFFVCYLTKLSRLCGILKATSQPYQNADKAAKIWKHDSFPCLIDVEPIVTLDFLHSVPKDEIVPKLSIAAKWGGIIRGSPTHLPLEDGEIIRRTLEKTSTEYPIRPKTGTHPPKRGGKQEYGAPIEFKGLRHAPLNEQGVVYVFALVARDLGFTVEAIGTSFPDCEAKRQIDKRGERWQRVRLEFEYFGSDFRRHGHPEEGCDLIVCWRNDWPECPLEVIELSEEIKKLGARFER